MQTTVRPAQERGVANFGWLDSRHTFSFGNYYDPSHIGFGPLRVINDDKVQPGRGFDTHGHQDMEIITYVLEGELAHKDSLGNGSTIRPGDVQRMSAGTGIRHSEFNPSSDRMVHFLQIWILPDRQGLSPSYEQITIPGDEKRDRLRLIGSPDGQDGSVTIHQDVRLYAAALQNGASTTHTLSAGRGAWIHVAQGSVQINEIALREGDGLALQSAGPIQMQGTSPEPADLLLFDLPL
ncbi:MAG: pirin family protein [Thermosynechococcaceae cyanobacterium]